MQTVAAYLMEHGTPGAPLPTLEVSGTNALRAVEKWLGDKGASDTSRTTGTYSAVDGSAATFRRSSAVDGPRKWDLFVLEEVTTEGRIFRTSVSVTVGASKVSVFLTMDIGTTLDNLTRVDANLKTPKIVRDVIALPGEWRYKESVLELDVSSVVGVEQGELLADTLRSEGRAIPFVVVSQNAGKVALPGISENIAFAVGGLANVVTVDSEASWALTKALGKPFSVFAGAVRLYWPGLAESTESPLRHQLWTAAKLKALPGGDASRRFVSEVRRILMEASAASITRPAEIEEIRTSESRAKLAALSARSEELDRLKAAASSIKDFEELANTYAAENDSLREQVGRQQVEAEELKSELESEAYERRRLSYQLRQLSAALEEADEMSPDLPEEEEPRVDPKPGEIRFYKKIGSKPKFDVLEPVAGCSHTSWQGSHGADKARKGLERLGLPKWKRLQHCGSCTGGGLWKVEW